jgi:hypothetical protein
VTTPSIQTSPEETSSSSSHVGDYGDTEMIALFRFFLEPPKMEVEESRVRVDKWSMSVVCCGGSPLDRSRTYTFGDLFSKSLPFDSLPPIMSYIDQITTALTTTLQTETNETNNTARDECVP